MALKWFLNSAFTQVFGHTDSSVTVQTRQRSDVVACPNNQGLLQVHECVRSSRDVKEGSVTRTRKQEYPNGFQVPLHYPRYTAADYEKMEEWKLDMLLNEYGLSFEGRVDEKRAFAMGAFLWPDQL
ncbi:uncharacterized protein LOC110601245 [Manihot esculenta]|uniref:DUF7722 domain-containing protein n=1 Tax=Manihot esculenta TaxID=3983 RepID=A0A2C9UDL3_MANES|nr:uncharacterized protein LOC110601245 [Manihot esculenta]OAY28374.1 hypothetical protein MANES_15G061400v8 [Manihot esculenta]